MTARLVSLMLIVAAVGGCTTVPVFHETGNTTDLRWWRTEGRRQWHWMGAPVGQQPEDVYFSTQEACERFRRQHPTYTKPEEVCQPDYGVVTKQPTIHRNSWGVVTVPSEPPPCAATNTCQPPPAANQDCTADQYWSAVAGGCVPR